MSIITATDRMLLREAVNITLDPNWSNQARSYNSKAVSYTWENDWHTPLLVAYNNLRALGVDISRSYLDEFSDTMFTLIVPLVEGIKLQAELLPCLYYFLFTHLHVGTQYDIHKQIELLGLVQRQYKTGDLTVENVQKALCREQLSLPI